MIANHTPSFVRREFPHGQVAALLELIHESVQEIAAALFVDDVEQRVQGTISIPQGKDRVHLVNTVSFVNLMILATITAIQVRIEIRRRKAMIQRCIENFQIFLVF